jgi:hypothetical protein
MTIPPPYGLHIVGGCAYNVHMRFNGQDSDTTLEDVVCEGCDEFFESVEAISWTRSFGEHVEWTCKCGHENSEDLHNL